MSWKAPPLGRSSVGKGSSGSEDNTGDSTGDNTGDSTGDSTGGNTEDNTGDNSGDNTGNNTEDDKKACKDRDLTYKILKMRKINKLLYIIYNYLYSFFLNYFSWILLKPDGPVGVCQKDSTACKGIYVSLMCPDEPADVRCCVGLGEYVTNNWVSRAEWGATQPKGNF